MRYFAVLMVLMAVFAAMAMAGPNPRGANDMYEDAKKHGKVKTKCLKGKLKNGKCIRSLRVRSADAKDYFEVPDVEDAHWIDEFAERDEEI